MPTLHLILSSHFSSSRFIFCTKPYIILQLPLLRTPYQLINNLHVSLSHYSVSYLIADMQAYSSWYPLINIPDSRLLHAHLSYTKEAEILIIILFLQKTSDLLFKIICAYKQSTKLPVFSYLSVGIFRSLLTLTSLQLQNWQLHMFLSMPQRTNNLDSKTNRHFKLADSV